MVAAGNRNILRNAAAVSCHDLHEHERHVVIVADDGVGMRAVRSKAGECFFDGSFLNGADTDVVSNGKPSLLHGIAVILLSAVGKKALALAAKIADSLTVMDFCKMRDKLGGRTVVLKDDRGEAIICGGDFYDRAGAVFAQGIADLRL